MQESRQQEGQMQLEALLRSRDQEVSSLTHRSDPEPPFDNEVNDNNIDIFQHMCWVCVAQVLSGQAGLF